MCVINNLDYVDHVKLGIGEKIVIRSVVRGVRRMNVLCLMDRVERVKLGIGGNFVIKRVEMDVRQIAVICLMDHVDRVKLDFGVIRVNKVAMTAVLYVKRTLVNVQIVKLDTGATSAM